MTRQDIEALFERRLDALIRRDARAFAEAYADDAVVESPLGGGKVFGLHAVEEIMRAWLVGFPDAVFTQEELLIDGNRVVWLARARGTDTGGFMGLPPTAKPFMLPMVGICTVDELITAERRIYDFTGLLVQIGVLKAKPA